MSTPAFLLVGFLFGIGFGYFVQRAGLCFAHGLGEIYMGKGRRILRMFFIIFVITTLGFLLSGYYSDSLGLKTIGQIRGFGFYNVLSGMFFGAGILLNGGCILGTLRQIGEGNMMFLVVFFSFIPGMALIVYGLNPILKDGYHTNNVLLPELLGASNAYVAISLAVAATIGLFFVSRKKRNQ